VLNPTLEGKAGASRSLKGLRHVGTSARSVYEGKKYPAQKKAQGGEAMFAKMFAGKAKKEKTKIVLGKQGPFSLAREREESGKKQLVASRGWPWQKKSRVLTRNITTKDNEAPR